jgi:hypothetical protein
MTLLCPNCWREVADSCATRSHRGDNFAVRTVSLWRRREGVVKLIYENNQTKKESTIREQTNK